MREKKDTCGIQPDARPNRPVIWGHTGLLKDGFVDIAAAEKCARGSVEFGVIDARVKAVRTKKNGAYTYEVFRTQGSRGKKPVKYILGHIVLGLNGHGQQVDYFTAMQKLVKDGSFAILDARIDIADDCCDLFVITDNKKKGKRHEQEER